MSVDAGVTIPDVPLGVRVDNAKITRDGNDYYRQRVETYNGSTSTLNSTDVALVGNATWTGSSEDVSGYGSVVVACKTDQAGTLYIEFSPDGTNWDSSISFAVVANVNEVHRLSVTRSHWRARYVNGSVAQGFFRLQAMLSNAPPLTSALNSTVQSDADSLVTRSVLMGQDDGGSFQFVPVDSSGHLEVAIHGPLLPFGSLHTENMTPIYQYDAVYGLNDSLVKTTNNSSGAVTHSNNLFVCSTGTTIGGFGTLQSVRRLRYRPGQGSITRFTALWSAPVANSIVIAGCGTSESGYYFGYNGTAFGVLHVTGGVREIQTLTVTTASTSTQPAQVTLNGVSYTVPMTNNGSTLRTAYELSQGSFGAWQAQASGSTVIFIAGSAGNNAGAFSIAQSGAATPVAGTYAETLAGAASTDTWVAQADWNYDKLNGTGPSGFTLDPTKGNIFQVDMQYLGFGQVKMSCYVTSSNNNGTWTPVHVFNFPNTRATPHTSQPSLPFTMAAYSAGSTTNVSVATASFAGFVEGQLAFTGPRMSYDDSSTTVSTGAYYALMTVRNDNVYRSRPNQSIVNLMNFGGAHDDATPVTLYLIRNGTLVGTPNFQPWSASSCTSVDTAATTVTIADNSQILFSIPLGGSGDGMYEFGDRVMLQPGDTVTLAAKAVTGTSTWTIATLNTREDQ